MNRHRIVSALAAVALTFGTVTAVAGPASADYYSIQVGHYTHRACHINQLDQRARLLHAQKTIVKINTCSYSSSGTRWSFSIRYR